MINTLLTATGSGFWTISNDSSSVKNSLVMFGVSVLLALFIAGVYWLIHRKSGFRPSLLVSFIILSPVATMIMIIVGSSLATAVSVGGGFLLIRYRATLDSPSDLAYIFLAMAAGMACGLGCIGFAIIAVFILCLILSIIHFATTARRKGADMKLKILIPESLDYYGAFDDILSKHCESYTLEKVKTSDFGTLLELSYRIRIRNVSTQKSMIDEIRCRNGNMNILLVGHSTED